MTYKMIIISQKNAITTSKNVPKNTTNVLKLKENAFQVFKIADIRVGHITRDVQ